jgi:hypothetical protein
MVWGGPESDVFMVLVEPTPDWAADPLIGTVALLRTLDDNEQETGQIAGIEIVGFLDFDRWDLLPDLPMLWEIPGWEPLTLEDLLRREQALLRQHSSVQTLR